MKKLFFILIFLYQASFSEVIVNEDFYNLNNWNSLRFKKINVLSSYNIIDNDILKAYSKNGASAIIYSEKFDVYKYPLAEWKWKVENIYQKGNAALKSGDDFPIRVYLIFQYSPKNSSGFKKIKYELAKKLYGEYPPHSALNYVWASKLEKGEIIKNPYSDFSRTLALESGNAKLGEWIVEKRNILEDYRAAFREDPPQKASIAIMADSDNTGEEATAYLDYIKVFGK